MCVPAGNVKLVGIVERHFVEARLELVERIVVRNVGGERDFPERLAAIRAGHGELAVLELDVGFRGLEQVRGDLLALVDDLVERLDDRGAADRQRARAVRAHAEQDTARVAVNDVDVLDRHAEPRGDHLRERRLVALSMAVRAREHRDAARRMHAHLARLEQARARPKGTRPRSTARCRRPRCTRRSRSRGACRASPPPPCAPQSRRRRPSSSPRPSSRRSRRCRRRARPASGTGTCG